MPPKLLWTCGVVPFDLTHGTISGRCGLQHHGLKQKVVCVFHKCREVSEGEMHGMNLGCIVRPWQTLNHTQFYWTNSWWQPPPVGEVWHSNQVENVKAELLSGHCWHWARLLHPSVMNIPLELIIRIILLETQNAQGKLSAMLFHNFSKAYHAVFIHFCSFKCSPLLRLLAQPPRRSVTGTRTPALEDSGERQRRSLENSARGKSHETQDDTKPTSFTLGQSGTSFLFTTTGDTFPFRLFVSMGHWMSPYRCTVPWSWVFKK